MLKFFCDEMLTGLGKWLRAAGYDTHIAIAGTSDQKLLDIALQEDRILLTRDGEFVERKDLNNRVIFLQGNSMQECVEELGKQLKIDWLYRPFTRCLVCNCLFVQADAQEKEKAPLDIRNSNHEIWYCKTCKKPFWQGSHTSRMLEQLKAWQKEIKPQ